MIFFDQTLRCFSRIEVDALGFHFKSLLVFFYRGDGMVSDPIDAGADFFAQISRLHGLCGQFTNS